MLLVAIILLSYWGAVLKICNWPVEKLLPHANNMVLIDELVQVDEESATCELLVRNGGLFSGPLHQVPGWIGLEYMAQSVAAWAGYHALARGETVKLGFLLGTRRYVSNVSFFPVGASLNINIERQYQSADGLAAFNCVIRGADILVSARLNVAQITQSPAQEGEES